MDMKTLDASAAYGSALNRATEQQQTGVAGAAGGQAAQGAGGFGALVDTMVTNVEDATRNAEQMSAKAVAGEAGLVDVVTAVNNAEMVLDTVTTVRDRVVKAYEEIMRMPI
ncbi:flagellar hook-basal body complex protein FliE [Rhodothalassium salexigens]|uniref:Flagellar hook-basal body complex protein FliE n=1 Tax=Rhodothalassium salexigens DSM 2132 TaxID=1188247 RepID=A0A4R2PBV6_RHOSA|nr:flagellar hook-basal body complex protein FliE [Rhodothalassium salexigens]MBB4212297.1 flagellar hook-basal body complex protein FliE [Rhodothalassium salexigens DSM 2132]MBK1638345.1 flagellar hook-basal body complex protein FliE [Rhodothalassium salexigens DSM 2132]MBK5910491.1 flagellar hook-basal body complex protein FliE [Rhodothalassium salexigens]MBK5921691.1 flagellar hook-basal body complex protein FliE [Rhodothalassium salexigens]TCP32552.1 flagellar hook-basal body complex prote